MVNSKNILKKKSVKNLNSCTLLLYERRVKISPKVNHDLGEGIYLSYPFISQWESIE